MEVKATVIKDFMNKYSDCCELNYHCQCNHIFKGMLNYLAECGASIDDDNYKPPLNNSEIVVADKASDHTAEVA